MNMSRSWIVIANTNEAYIGKLVKKERWPLFSKIWSAFERQNKKIDRNMEFRIIQKHSHPESLKREHELVSDKPGDYQVSTKARGVYEPPSNHHKIEQDRFAAELSKVLQKAYMENHYQMLTLCAEPHFWGLLQSHLSPQIMKCITQLVEKDYVPLVRNNKRKLVKRLVYIK